MAIINFALIPKGCLSYEVCCFVFQMYTSYIKKHSDIIIELEKYAKKSSVFEKAYKEFEVRFNPIKPGLLGAV